MHQPHMMQQFTYYSNCSDIAEFSVDKLTEQLTVSIPCSNPANKVVQSDTDMQMYLV